MPMFKTRSGLLKTQDAVAYLPKSDERLVVSIWDV